MHRLILTLATIAAFGFVTAAEAKTVRERKSVRAGQTTKIDHYSGWKPDCSFLQIEIDVVDEPKHGSYRPKIGRGTVPVAQTSGGRDNCTGRPMRVIVLYYTPERGFRGRDKMIVRMRTPGHRDVRFVYTINVR